MVFNCWQFRQRKNKKMQNKLKVKWNFLLSITYRFTTNVQNSVSLTCLSLAAIVAIEQQTNRRNVAKFSRSTKWFARDNSFRWIQFCRRCWWRKPSTRRQPDKLERMCLDHCTKSNRDACRIQVESIAKSSEALWIRPMYSSVPHDDFDRYEEFGIRQPLQLHPSPVPELLAHLLYLFRPTHRYVVCTASCLILWLMQASRSCGRQSRESPWFVLGQCVVSFAVPVDWAAEGTSLASAKCKRFSLSRRLSGTFLVRNVLRSRSNHRISNGNFNRSLHFRENFVQMNSLVKRWEKYRKILSFVVFYQLFCVRTV